MRLIARMPDRQQVGALLDSLKNMGIERSDMVVSDMAGEQEFRSVEEATEKGISMIKTERNSLNDVRPFTEGIDGTEGETGIIVTVNAPRHGAAKIKEIMEQSEAIEIEQG